MRLAFIGGCGHLGLAPCVEDPSCNIEPTVAVASDGYCTESARKVAARFKQVKWFDDPVEMLDTFKPDIVNIGPMFGYTGRIAAMVLERGIPVVGDKPLAATWEQYERLRELAGRTDAALITELAMRSFPPFRAAHLAVKSGAIGKVVLAKAVKSYRFGERPRWFGEREKFGGLMLWVASHGIDFIHYCSGRRLSRVVGTGGNLSRPDYPEMEDHCMAMFEFEGGGSAVVHADYLRPKGADSHGDDRLRLAGTEGQIEVLNGVCTLIDANGTRDITHDYHPQPPHIELLAAALGKDKSVYSTQHSLEIGAILLHARDAADTRTWVDIPAR